MSQPIREVDPGELRLPPGRASGADPWKLHQQIRQHGSSRSGMPPILVYEDPDGVLEISDRVTRATRIANAGAWPNGLGRGHRAVSTESSRFPSRERSDMSQSDTRSELFAALRELSEVIPEMRSGQLMAAVGELCSDLHGRGLWDADDDELLEALWQFRRNYEAAVTASREGA